MIVPDSQLHALIPICGSWNGIQMGLLCVGSGSVLEPVLEASAVVVEDTPFAVVEDLGIADDPVLGTGSPETIGPLYW